MEDPVGEARKDALEVSALFGPQFNASTLDRFGEGLHAKKGAKPHTTPVAYVAYVATPGRDFSGSRLDGSVGSAGDQVLRAGGRVCLVRVMG